MQELIVQWFTTYAYEPIWVYLGMVVMMTLAAFGLPFPEEIVIVTVGIVCHFARHPELYPPPHPDAVGVNIGVAATMGFISVLASDLVIYFLGRRFGRGLLVRPWFGRQIPASLIERVERWMRRYGFWASGLFRFTPGLRFPGHLACGAMGVPIRKFIAVDGGAALISIPTQIMLIGIYGDTVIEYLKSARTILMILVLGLILILTLRWWRRSHSGR